MADLNALIAQGYQPPALPDPFAQHAKMQQLENATLQSQLLQQQSAAAKLTYDRNLAAQTFVNGIMKKAKESGADVTDPMDAAKQMLMNPNPTVQAMGKHLAEAHQLIRTYDQQKAFDIANTPGPASTDTSAAAPVAKYVPPGSLGGPTQTAAPMAGAMGSGSFDVNAPAAPVANALAPAAASVNALAPAVAATAPTAESVAAQIKNGDIRFGSVPGWKAQREILVKQYDQLVKPPTLHVVEGSLVGPDGKVIYQGENISKQRLEFDQKKFDWEKANPGYEVKEVPQANGTIKLVGVNKRTNEAVPITMSGKELVSPNLAAQRLSFDQNKFAWEKANPGKTIKEVPQADGTTQFFAIDNRTGSATPVMMAGAAPAAGGRGAVGVTDNRGAVGTPLVGTSTKNAPDHFVKTDMQLAGLAGSLKAFKDEVKANPTTGAKWLPTGEDTARMQSKYTSLLMGLKDLYALGALTGPDMSIIESQITNPASWAGKFTSQKGFEEQIKTVEDMLKRSSTNLENSYNLKPKATKKALESLPGGTSSASDPLGIR